MHVSWVHAGHPMQESCHYLSKQPQVGATAVHMCRTHFWDFCWLLVHHVRMLQYCILCAKFMLLPSNTFLQQAAQCLATSLSQCLCWQSIAVHEELKEVYARQRQAHLSVSEKASSCDEQLAAANAK